jgi:hypothetical protein
MEYSPILRSSRFPVQEFPTGKWGRGDGEKGKKEREKREKKRKNYGDGGFFGSA